MESMKTHVEELQAEGRAKEHQLQNEVAAKVASRRKLVVSNLQCVV